MRTRSHDFAHDFAQKHVRMIERMQTRELINDKEGASAQDNEQPQLDVEALPSESLFRARS